MNRVHFIGIGGVGMNGLAQLAVRRGLEVSGSDRARSSDSFLFRCLEGMGVRLVPQDGNGLSPRPDVVVYSTAIEPDNPDLGAAERLGVPLLHRAEFLERLVADAPLIAIAGTAGKTTVAGMLGHVFERLGKNPTLYNGAALLDWRTDAEPGNVRLGDPACWIAELDESDRSLLRFRPTHAILTNVSKDHFDLDELHRIFGEFRRRVSGEFVEGSSTGIPLDAVPPLRMPGRHNRENARCVMALCERLGLDRDAVRQALADFRGIERRLEKIDSSSGIAVFDDYAHNPAKIAASIAAVEETFPRTHVYWRPHGFAPLAQNLNDFADVFAARRSPSPSFILPVYYAGGTVERTVDAPELVRLIRERGGSAETVENYAALEKSLRRHVLPGDAILGMGARDPQLPRFARQIAGTISPSTPRRST